jgi:hypothetical protein
MGLARVVRFEGVGQDRIEEIRHGIESEEAPEGLPAKEIVVLHDADAETALVIVFFDTEDDYTRGDALLSAMPAGDTPGRRVSVEKYAVPIRRTA